MSPSQNLIKDLNLSSYAMLQFMVFFIGSFNFKKPKSDRCKKTIMSIWTTHYVHVQCDGVVKLDLIILTTEVIDKMTNYLISG